MGLSEHYALSNNDETIGGNAAQAAWVNLSLYDNRSYSPGRNRFVCALWYFVSLLVFESGWIPLGAVKRLLLRLFGARIGCGLVIKPQVWIKYPWRLVVGDHCWIGQGVCIDNLADVQLGSHVCISQQVYLCTGSHDYRKPSFDLITRPVTVDDGAWLGAGPCSRECINRRERNRRGRQHRHERRGAGSYRRRKSGPAA